MQADLYRGGPPLGAGYTKWLSYLLLGILIRAVPGLLVTMSERQEAREVT